MIKSWISRMGVLLSVVCLVILTGCATSGVLQKKNQVQQWPYPKFNKQNPPTDVTTALKWADAYRDLTHRNLFPTAAYGSAYWYAEESEKYYRHILDELEPHNAYAAVNLGYLSLIRARGVTMTNDKDLFLSTAYAKFNDADSMRKGFAAAHIYMAEYYVMRKDYGKAIDKYEDLQRSGIEDAYIHAWWGYALKKSGRPAEARKHFMKAVEAGDPEASAAWSRKQI